MRTSRFGYSSLGFRSYRKQVKQNLQWIRLIQVIFALTQVLDVSENTK